ncbi:hypothetical protein D3C87_2107960 [compost metagenome]
MANNVVAAPDPNKRIAGDKQRVILGIERAENIQQGNHGNQPGKHGRSDFQMFNALEDDGV